jgi:hypothetical protein
MKFSPEKAARLVAGARSGKLRCAMTIAALRHRLEPHIAIFAAVFVLFSLRRRETSVQRSRDVGHSCFAVGSVKRALGGARRGLHMLRSSRMGDRISRIRAVGLRNLPEAKTFITIDFVC